MSDEFPITEAMIGVETKRPTASSKRMSEWQKIETAPKDGRSILIWQSRTARPWKVARWDLTWQRWLFGGKANAQPQISHWQPLPDPPVEDNGSN
jgi:hypothetical protein